uniref:Uncharacterized protein n=1 Tax=Panagrolaimus superbus TaxID=310955 RepID=A0A914XVP1_9BILA
MFQTPSKSSDSDTSTNRILSEHVETPSPPSSIATSKSTMRRSSSSAEKLPIFNIKTNIQIFDDDKKDDKVLPRQPILTKEILDKAAKIEEKLVAHNDAKVKFQLSFLLSPKKLRNYKKEKKIWKSQDPINVALEESHRKRFIAPSSKKPAESKSKMTTQFQCNQKLVLQELTGKFHTIDPQTVEGKVVKAKVVNFKDL